MQAGGPGVNSSFQDPHTSEGDGGQPLQWDTRGKPCHLLGYQTHICSPQETPHRTTATIKTAWSDCSSFPGQHQCSWPQEDAAHPLIHSSTTGIESPLNIQDNWMKANHFVHLHKICVPDSEEASPPTTFQILKKNTDMVFFFQLLNRGSKYQAELQTQAFFWGRNCCRLFFVLYFLHYTGPISTLFHSHSFFHLVSVLLLCYLSENEKSK